MGKNQEEPKAKFQHLRNDNNKLYATICIISDEEKAAYGVSILGDHDNFDRRMGKRRALSRARRAWYTNKNSFPMFNGERKNVLYFLENITQVYTPGKYFKSYCIRH